MTWKRKDGRDGLPVWEGADSIADPFLWEQQERFGWSVVGISALLIWLGVIAWAMIMSVLELIAYPDLADLMTSRNNGSMGTTSPPSLIVGLIVVGGVIWIMRNYARLKPDGLITRRWFLKATVDGLTYSAGHFSRALDPIDVSAHGISWSVKLASIARVESAHTTEWQAGRVYEGGPGGRAGPAAVPPHEYQTFLFLADGSRRVFCTVNIHREDAATLAHSVRSWLEAMKAQAVVPVRTYARAEGFDI